MGRFLSSSSSRETSGKKGVSDFPFYLNLQHMETVGTVNFEDLFDFSPEPLDSPLENSSAEKLDDQEDYDQFNHLINQGVVVESGSNRSQSSQLSSPPATGSYGVSPQESTGKAKRGRKPNKGSRADMKTKLERSRESARECRARKKLRYQYLDDLLLEREKANLKLREELMTYQKWCHELDKGRIPDGLQEMLKEFTEEMNNGGNGVKTEK